MNRLMFKFIVAVGLLVTVCTPPIARARQEQVAAVEQLKSEAFEALKGGDFNKTNELLNKAAELSGDPILSQMADWTRNFEAQREGFAVERRKQYDEAVGRVQLLLQNGKDDFAIDEATRAHLLAEDKEVFQKEKWVRDLIADTVRIADRYETSDQWVKALRVYSDLGSIEPANPLWKEKLKSATRRLRLLALYAPDELKAVQEAEIKERKEVDALLNPSTQPSTQPLADADESAEENFRIDWHETLRGVRYDMLWDALVDARTNYYRDINYRMLMIGGLEGLRAIVTTKGLEQAFPGMSDTAKRDAFVKTIDEQLAEAERSNDDSEQLILRSALAKVRTVNAQTVELPEEVMVSEFADGAFAQLDPFTSMIWPSDLEEFNKTTQGEFSGVGIQIQSDDDGSLKVVSPLEDSPAYKAGIKAGDIVTHINGKNAKGISLNQAVKNITGPSGTSVTLMVRSPDGEVKEYAIRRETIKVDSVKGWLHLPGGGWEYFVDDQQKIAYLRMTNFTKSTSDELDTAVRKMQQQGARALILDLRYNPGGLLTAATEVSDRFMRDGTIVSTRADRETPNQPTVATAGDEDGEVDMPTVVLVNQYSASASEIVSGALKDSKRALVVGERTFGKGSVQMLFPLANRQAYLKLTTSHYYLPSGRCIHREETSEEWGVDPDVKVEMTPKQMEAAIEARQELDILRDAHAAPAEDETQKLRDVAEGVRDAVEEESVASVDQALLEADPQLSAALLLLRLQLAGAQL